jgi:hypothetical protein
MTNFMDKETEDAFNSYGLIDEETQAEFEAEKIATLAMIDQLEAKYSSRGLKFTQPFHGACPVQAYGHIDGIRFYFRFRGNWGSLKVGPYNREIEELYAMRLQEDSNMRKLRAQKRFASGEINQRQFEFSTEFEDIRDLAIVEESASNFYPHIISKVSSCEGHTPGDDYNGYLDNKEAYDMFSQLVDSLEDIPENLQLDEGFRVWMYEGRAAMEKWQQSNKN